MDVMRLKGLSEEQICHQADHHIKDPQKKSEKKSEICCTCLKEKDLTGHSSNLHLGGYTFAVSHRQLSIVIWESIMVPRLLASICSVSYYPILDVSDTLESLRDQQYQQMGNWTKIFKFPGNQWTVMNSQQPLKSDSDDQISSLCFEMIPGGIHWLH